MPVMWAVAVELKRMITMIWLILNDFVFVIILFVLYLASLTSKSIHFIFRKMFLKSKVEACKVLGLVLVIVSLSHCMSGRTKDIASGVVFAAIDAILILG